MMVKNAGRVMVCGRSGSGKSTWTKARLARFGRVVVLDPMDEYAALGFRRVRTLRALLAGIKAGWAGGFRLAYVPAFGTDAQALHELSHLLLKVQAPYKAARESRKLALVVDELADGFPTGAPAQGLDGFSRVARQGRHYGIEVVGITQRPSGVDPVFRGNCDTRVFFSLTEAIDLDAVARMIGRDHARTVGRLAPHEYLKRDLDGTIKRGRNKIA